MTKVILIRFGEIFLKGNNKYYFENALVTNIKKSLYGIQYTLKKLRNRYFIEQLSEDDYDVVLSRLCKVCGVFSISPAYKINATMEEMGKIAVDMINPEIKTFRISCNRGDKRFPLNSMQVDREIGGMVLDKYPHLKVALTNAQTEIKIDIREDGYAYVFSEILPAVGGMPVGTSQRGVVLLSGGIDSPVALFRMAKRGMEVVALHFHSFPYTSELAKEKVIKLAKILTQYAIKIRMVIVPVTEIQQQIHNNCPESMMITLLRRFMMRIAKKVALYYGCLSVTTGESLAQVASQTQESIVSTNEVIDIPVFRPLIGMDKCEIIETAKQIGTFETSIEPFEDCCTVFLPKSPAIHPKLDYVHECEKVLDIDGLVQRAFEQNEYMELKISDN